VEEKSRDLGMDTQRELLSLFTYLQQDLYTMFEKEEEFG
jgi:hypothetical protein